MRPFVAVGNNGICVVSENGTDWKRVALGKDGDLYRSICFAEGRYVAVGNRGGENLFSVSMDGGQTWKTEKRTENDLNMRCVLYGGGQFLASGGDAQVGDSGRNALHLSKDGENWSPLVQYGGKLIRRITYGNGIFVGVGDYGRYSVSKDGTKWTDPPKSGEGPSQYKVSLPLVDVAFGNGIFVCVGLNSYRMTSTDGLHWTHAQSGEEGEHLNSILWTGDRFVAAGPQVTFFSPDGVTWQRTPNKNGPLTMIYSQGLFLGTHWKGRILLSKDAITWTQVYRTDQNLQCLS